MRFTLLIASFLALALPAFAAPQGYPRDVARWQEVSIPPETDRGSRAVWLLAANRSTREWRVFSEHGQVCAQLTTAKPSEQRDRPKFNPTAGQFRRASAFARVNDGWLVAFNQGEYGGALYWFSLDGKRNYKISDHQVVDFFLMRDALYAIEGLAHITLSAGSVILIAQAEPGGRWLASTVTKLPFAPYAVTVGQNHSMLITLSDSLVSIGSDNKINTILPNAPWGGLYPNSSALSPDEQKLYIGMRQFVGEFDIPTKKFRLLIPSNAFLNKLPEEDQRQIRERSGG